MGEKETPFKKWLEGGIKTMKLYYHKTDGGAEYLCSGCVKGTNEGSFDSKYIIRIDGNIKKDAELFVK